MQDLVGKKTTTARVRGGFPVGELKTLKIQFGHGRRSFDETFGGPTITHLKKDAERMLELIKKSGLLDKGKLPGGAEPSVRAKLETRYGETTVKILDHLTRPHGVEALELLFSSTPVDISFSAVPIEKRAGLLALLREGKGEEVIKKIQRIALQSAKDGKITDKEAKHIVDSTTWHP